MTESAHESMHPDWDALYAVAEAQAGYFTTTQAEAAGYYAQLLQKHLASGRIERVRRGIYRLVRFPASEHEELVVLWLWSEQEGVFSHETALALHGLSDVLPALVHMTLPLAQKARRRRRPEGLVLHHAELERAELSWFAAVPLTAPLRTLGDCIAARVSPEFLDQAIAQARRRGLISAGTERELRASREQLE